MSVAGKTTHMKIVQNGSMVYIGSKILQESVLKLEPVGD